MRGTGTLRTSAKGINIIRPCKRTDGVTSGYVDPSTITHVPKGQRRQMRIANARKREEARLDAKRKTKHRNRKP